MVSHGGYGTAGRRGIHLYRRPEGGDDHQLGENIYPAEVDRVIQALPEVREAAVVGMPDRKKGEVVAAFVLLKEGAELTEEALLAAIRDRIAHFKLPKKIVFVDDFPRNSAGKILKKELKGRLP